ncbi:uncharacterized protein LOC110443031 [Mizuhopecten yessoensis]|uniref:C1q domain-containing protein n=1 Tax=Mizuhopecten yessoensis TaxID=6573 RepID=A0A210PFY2_MIZYE|nr:uncharacterized protein LOC110443031 [Mizuhopecten yessoensis]OWF35356.1 hypothetical protein KP79_PYT19483 [Mizuhopecten yessoensis]
MSARLVIVLWLFGSICEINGAALSADDMFQRWTDFVATYDNKVAKLESLLTEKDERISLLEAKLDIEIEKKNSEMAQLKRDMTMLIQNTNILNKYKSAFTDEFEGKDVEEMELNVDIENSPTVARPENNAGLQKFKGDNTTHTNISKTVRHDDKDIKVDRLDGSRRGVERETLRRYRRVAPTPTVAFHTKMSSPRTLANGITIMFDEEALDQGNGYNQHDGIYTVPVSGTYVMTWKVLSAIHSVIHTSLVVNGVVMGNSDTDSEDITDIHQTTAIVVLRLNQGDLVLVRVTGTNLGGIVSDTFHGKATFSGWKI